MLFLSDFYNTISMKLPRNEDNKYSNMNVHPFFPAVSREVASRRSSHTMLYFKNERRKKVARIGVVSLGHLVLVHGQLEIAGCGLRVAECVSMC